MALPRRTTGSLWPTFVSARLVSLAVRQAYAIALNDRFPTGLSPPSRASVTFWEATAPVKLPTMRCPGCCDTAVRHPCQQGWYLILRLHEDWRPRFIAYHLSCTCRHECQRKARVKVHGVIPSDRGNPASSRGIQF